LAAARFELIFNLMSSNDLISTAIWRVLRLFFLRLLTALHCHGA
jgi:hypothetical protein